jgi:hypothetical protein
MGSDHFRVRGAVIVHLDDQNLPPAGTSSFCTISEHYFDNRYISKSCLILGGKEIPLPGDMGNTNWRAIVRVMKRRLGTAMIGHSVSMKQ